MDCDGLGLSEKFLKKIVTLTGPNETDARLGLTFSDIRTRLLPEALSKAYPDRKISEEDLLAAVHSVAPSPRA